MPTPTRTLLLLTLMALVAVVPSHAAGTVLTSPSRKAIPLLVSRNGNVIKFGTGVVVGRTTVLTAKHVVWNRPEVRFPSGTVRGQTVCRSRSEDLAVVRARLPEGTPFYQISSRKPVVGERVQAAGYPGKRWTVARGTVTHVISSARLGGRVVHSPMIIFKPALIRGASGSPLFDRNGRVVGIFVASNGRENYSIAFPVATLLKACKKFVH